MGLDSVHSHDCTDPRASRFYLEVDEGWIAMSADARDSGEDTGWRVQRTPMQVGVGHTVRDLRDGQSLASLGRWPVSAPTVPQQPWNIAVESLALEEVES